MLLYKMGKERLAIFLIGLFLLNIIAVSALNSGEAKKEWREAKQKSIELQQQYNEARIRFAGNQSEENKQELISAGKDVMNAALDEVDAWLTWKKMEAEESIELPDDIKEAIKIDVEKNKGKIIELRSDVTNIKNQFEMGVIFLKMVGKYMELLTDVARDTGKAFVHRGNKYIEAAQNYEEKLRAEAEKIDNNQAIIEKLDKAKSDITEAKSNVDKAEASYGQVVLPGTPLIKFAEGNNYMRTARTNLMSALSNLNSAYTLMIAGGA